jgi:hypothetical protein
MVKRAPWPVSWNPYFQIEIGPAVRFGDGFVHLDVDPADGFDTSS